MSKKRKLLPRSENHLLAKLSPTEYAKILPQLEPVTLNFQQLIYPPGGPIDFVYFPTFGVVSFVAQLSDHRTIEVGIAGREGVVGASGILGDPTSPFLVQVQVAGTALRMEVDAFRTLAQSRTTLQRLLARYQAAFFTLSAQSAACNGLHSVYQRCCRWLLMTHDRMGSDTFGLTHEFLGTMLGVRRASVSDVLGPLQTAGLVGYSRGRVTILNRAAIEKETCECYRFVRHQFERLLPE